MKKETCKTCIHWQNKQRELNYYDDIGFCVNPKFKFNINTGRIVGVYDKENRNDPEKVTGNPAHDFESKDMHINFKQYILQTSDLFGCNYYKENK